MHELEHRYYRPSGAVPATSTALMMVIGIVACAGLGILFELLKRYLGHPIILVAASLGYGAVAGLAVQWAARVSHVRNPKFAMFVGFFVGLFAVWIAWIWYIWIHSGYNANALRNAVTQPQFVVDVMRQIAAIGIWELFDWRPKGGTLYAIWAVEAVMIVGFTIGLSAAGSPTYCEACRKWTKKLDLLLHVPLVEPEPLKADLEAENYDSLYRLIGKPFTMVQRIDVTATKCPTCADANFLTVALTSVTNNGEQEVVQIEPIVKHLIVPIDVIETLQGQRSAEPDTDGDLDDDATVE